MKNTKNFNNSKSAKVMSTKRSAKVTPPLQSTNSSSRKNSTDIRPQSK